MQSDTVQSTVVPNGSNDTTEEGSTDSPGNDMSDSVEKNDTKVDGIIFCLSGLIQRCRIKNPALYLN